MSDDVSVNGTPGTRDSGSVAAEPILEARSLNVSYGSNRAVRDVSLTVQPNSVTALIAPAAAERPPSCARLTACTT